MSIGLATLGYIVETSGSISTGQVQTPAGSSVENDPRPATPANPSANTG